MTHQQAADVPEEVFRSVGAEDLLAPGRPVVVMLSGGRDSVCLLDLAVRVAGSASVRALHVNYGLRAESEEDQHHCERLCQRLGVELSVERAPAEREGNLQAWARQLRYRAAGELAGALEADIAVGHTATDQVETILYRLASSPSRRALLGMRAREPLRGAHHRWLIRPLLKVTRAQTASYCRARELPWREDPTNEQDQFARSRVRAGVVPALRAIHPAAERNVLALAQILRDEADVLDELVAGVLAGADAIPLERLRALSPALARLVVQRLADQAAGEPAPGTARRLEELLALPDRGKAAIDLPHGVRAIAQRGALRFVRRPIHWEPVNADDAIGEILVPAEDLARRVSELAAEVSRDYVGKDLVLVGVLKGAVFFLSDLMRALKVPVELDFMAVASYGSATKSSGVVRILKDLDVVIEGRDVLIVEDIVDSGLTLQYLLRNLGARNPRSLEVCALLIKPERRKVELRARYVGFEIPNRFAIGYGLDHRERYRNLPYVAALKD